MHEVISIRSEVRIFEVGNKWADFDYLLCEYSANGGNREFILFSFSQSVIPI
jgi:hypothetical protein